MVILIPVIVLIVGALTAAIMYRLRANTALIWLISVGLVAIAWVSVLVLRWRLPMAISSRNWFLAGTPGDALEFSFSVLSFPYIFAFIGMLLAILLTATARLKQQSIPATWAANMALAAITVLSLMASTPLGLILSWVVLDLTEVIIIFLAPTEQVDKGRSLVAFAVKMAGTLLIVAALVVSRAEGVWLSLDQPTQLTGLMLILAAGLRLGLLPLYVPFERELPLRRGLGLMIRMASPISAMMLLARLPAGLLTASMTGWLMVFASLSALYGAVIWAARADALNHRPYWVLAVTGLAFLTVLHGQAETGIAWGIALLTSGGIASLYSVRNRRLMILPALSSFILVGVPYTPLAVGWQGLTAGPIDIATISSILIVSLLLVGYVRDMLKPGEDPDTLDPWIRAVYPIGLVVLVITPWIIWLWDIANVQLFSGWWGSLAAVVLASIGLSLIFIKGKESVFPKAGWINVVSQPVGKLISSAMSLNWLYRLFWGIYRMVQWVIQAFTSLVEGDGGFIWTMVFLALLVSLFGMVSGQ